MEKVITYHFWPNSGRINIPANDVAGCYVTVKARLVIDDVNKPDDRDKAKYLMSVGGDWWQSLTAPWDNFKTNADIGIGRFRYITSEWKSFNMYSVHPDTIQNNPPPFVNITTGFSSVNKTERLAFTSIFTFAGSTEIVVFNPENQNISLSVFDLNGKIIEILANRFLISGIHCFNWNSSSLKSGIYLIKLASANQNITGKIKIFR